MPRPTSARSPTKSFPTRTTKDRGNGGNAARKPPKVVLLRLRHPKSLPMKGVTVNGNAWTDFDPAKEVISLHDMEGTVKVECHY